MNEQTVHYDRRGKAVCGISTDYGPLRTTDPKDVTCEVCLRDIDHDLLRAIGNKRAQRAHLVHLAIHGSEGSYPYCDPDVQHPAWLRTNEIDEVTCPECRRLFVYKEPEWTDASKTPPPKEGPPSFIRAVRRMPDGSTHEDTIQWMGHDGWRTVVSNSRFEESQILWWREAENREVPEELWDSLPSRTDPSPDFDARPTDEKVNHPSHYGGDTTYEAIKVIEAWGLDASFCIGNAVKYLCRAGRKGDRLEDLEKARWYLNREIDRLKKEMKENDGKEPAS